MFRMVCFPLCCPGHDNEIRGQQKQDHRDSAHLRIQRGGGRTSLKKKPNKQKKKEDVKKLSKIRLWSLVRTIRYTVYI